ncbi:inositol monophosphatase [Azospirillum sp. TSO22-1]|nr:inositol monophosphatase [Azospirillum sp. TSO22-1]PWC42149.1 inositol monophosphatase [Azospirillum sp. TSO22-1]
MTFTLSDALRIGEILFQASRTEIMPRFGALVAGQAREKSSRFDVVTDADEAAERAISTALETAYPGAVVVGEEATACNPTLLDAIGTADLAFVLDPLDGTKNFASGLPLFGAMVAATVRGEVVLAAIHDPVCGNTAFALRGEGAWIQAEGDARADLSVAAAVPVRDMHAIIGTNFLPEPLRTTVNGNLSRLGMSAWLRCAAHEYRMAAAGHCDVLFYNKLMPWDHAAGWLLHREAGGYSAHFDGTAYLPSHRTGGLICAPDEASWRLVREALLEPREPPQS